MTHNEGVTSGVRRIEPHDAERMLQRVFVNSRADQRMLQAYERDMRDGRWMLNGSPIVVSRKGEILDGRMRLLACVRTKTPFDTLIVEGIDQQSYETIDTVRKRTLADVLSIRNEQHGRALAAALRIIWSINNGSTPGVGKAPSPIALLSLLEERSKIRDSVLPALRASPLLPHGCGIAIHYLFSQIDQHSADKFISFIGQPISSSDSNPVNLLKNTLLNLKNQGGTRKQSYMLAIAIKSWNAFQAKRSLKLLKYDTEREAFPRIEGKNDWGPLGNFKAEQHPTAVAAQSCQNKNSIIASVELITPEFAERY